MSVLHMHVLVQICIKRVDHKTSFAHFKATNRILSKHIFEKIERWKIFTLM